MRTGLLVLILALGVSGARGESYGNSSVDVIESAVRKDPAAALQLIDKQINDVERDLDALYRRDNGFSPKDRSEQEAALASWQDYLAAMRKKAQDRLKATARDGQRIPAGVVGAAVTR